MGGTGRLMVSSMRVAGGETLLGAAAGSLDVSARFVGGSLGSLAVDLRRPPVARLFAGQSPAQVVARVPLLFSLCARAQQAAAAAAVAAAEGGAPPPVDDGALWGECLHEHLWRLCIDWPRALGVPDAATDFAAWRKSRATPGLIAASTALVAAAVDGGVIEKCLDVLVDRGSPAAAAVRPAPQEWLAAVQAGGEEPPAPASAVSIGAAYRRRVADLHGALAGLRDGRPYPVGAAGGGGLGVGQAATARGVLTHLAILADGKVADWHIRAPTDRLFATPGPLATVLGDDPLPDAGAARKALELAVLALDPCLPWRVEVVDA